MQHQRNLDYPLIYNAESFLLIVTSLSVFVYYFVLFSFLQIIFKENQMSKHSYRKKINISKRVQIWTQM